MEKKDKETGVGEVTYYCADCYRDQGKIKMKCWGCGGKNIIPHEKIILGEVIKASPSLCTENPF